MESLTFRSPSPRFPVEEDAVGDTKEEKTELFEVAKTVFKKKVECNYSAEVVIRTWSNRTNINFFTNCKYLKLNKDRTISLQDNIVKRKGSGAVFKLSNKVIEFMLLQLTAKPNFEKERLIRINQRWLVTYDGHHYEYSEVTRNKHFKWEIGLAKQAYFMTKITEEE